MRPRGEIRQVLARGLELGRGTSRELAVRTGVGVTAARETLNNMRRSGEVLSKAIPVPGVRRPVPVYELAGAASRPHASLPANDAAARWESVTCWMQWPCEA